MSQPRAACLVILGISLAWPDQVVAQAWLSPRGEGSLSLAYQVYGFDDHFDSTGEKVKMGGARSHTLIADLSYGLRDDLEVGVSIPFITSRSVGPFPPGLPIGPIDDGKYHGTLQDFRTAVRYKALATRHAIATPFAEVTLPTHEYATAGEAAPGRKLRELGLGIAAGVDVPPPVGGYVQARYAYSFVERVRSRSQNRSNMDIEFGQFINPTIMLRAFGVAQISHGGFDMQDFASMEEFRLYDRAMRANFFNLGGGVSIALSDATALHTTYTAVLAGRNTHRAQSLSLAVSFRLSPNRLERAPSVHAGH